MKSEKKSTNMNREEFPYEEHKQFEKNVMDNSRSSEAGFDLLLYGRAGSGKTTFAATAPPPVHIIDVDGKAEKVEAVVHAIKRGHVKVINAQSPLTNMALGHEFRSKTISDNPRGYFKIVDILNDYIEGKIKCGENNQGTLVLDSLTRVLDHLKRLIRDFNRDEIEGNKEKNIKKNPYVLWEVYLSNCEDLITKILTVKQNVIVIAHESNTINDEENSGGTRPWVQGQMGGKLSGYFTNVWRCDPRIRKEDDKTLYRSLTRAVMSCEARNSGSLDTFVNNDLREIFPDSYEEKK